MNSLSRAMLVSLFWLSAVGNAIQSSADTVFFDDFSDGDAQDGMPATWLVLPPFTGTADASSGELLLTPNQGASLQGIVTTVPEFTLDDVSIRTQVRLVEPPSTQANIELIARANRNNVTGYLGGVLGDGTVYIAKANDGLPNLTDVQTDLRPANEDVILQFDVFGNSLSMWAWRPGEPMPSAPLLTLTDSDLAQGQVGIDYAAGAAAPMLGSGLVRYVHVANTHIPEPSTFILTALALIGLVASRRRA